MSEHPIDQVINCVDSGNGKYIVGIRGVTRIEACTKSGMHADIPYIRVWADDHCMAEFCQHTLSGVYFYAPDEGSDAYDYMRTEQFDSDGIHICTNDILRIGNETAYVEFCEESKEFIVDFWKEGDTESRGELLSAVCAKSKIVGSLKNNPELLKRQP